MRSHLYAAKLVACVFAAILCGGLLVTDVAAQDAKPSWSVRFQSAKTTLGEYEDKVNAWQRDSSLAMAMMLVVVGLGGLTMALPVVKKPWVASATIITGALVSSVTVFNNSLFDADYKTLSRRAGEGRRLLRSANELLTLQGPSDADNEAIMQEIQKRVISLSLLDSDGRSASAVKASSLSLFETVFAAAPQSCGCSSAQPKESGFEFFCGSATAASISDARKDANERALKQAADHLERQRRLAGGSALEYARNSATEADSCVSRSAGGFTFAVWLRIPVSLLSNQAQQAFAPRATPRSTRLRLERIAIVQDGSSGASGWSFDVLADGKLLFQLPNRNYSDDAKVNTYTPSPKDAASADLAIGGAPVRVQINGRRSVGGDTVTGSVTIDGTSNAISVTVKNPTSERKGSFVFHFSLRSAAKTS